MCAFAKKKEVRSLHGFSKRLVKNFSSIATPLNDLVKKNVVFKWDDMYEKAFNLLKDKLTNAPCFVCLISIKLLKLNLMLLVLE
ncbi:hypothetical protein CR513_03620, partial [Mucuna pruriens]